MKLPLILCCLIVMFECTFANGQNGIKDFFEKIHDTSEKIKSDLNKFTDKFKSDFQKILQPKTNKINSVENVKSDNKGASTSTTTVSTPSNKSTASTVTTLVNSDSRLLFPTDDQEGLFVMPERPTTTSTQAPVTGKDGKDGKENFKGGCLPGYFYTSDGRCMPAY